ncbi:hypothetical protein Terro_3880 [Terriglobus roseus DSM 18391]|uniref:HicB family protein n=1 Tax=Terriglobus roseus (strain DSM 18391 / NRRL B-41598 / KBS 63) TaxID=926566 RepID=I3ZLH1_TERRK|nr:hypothetical protein Terro_3880 [Terriglobus roseus DSM 18391]
MQDDTSNAPPGKPIVLESPVVRDKTVRVKLAASLRRHAELVARGQGVSLNYLVTKAIEEKITRFRLMKEARHGSSDGVHLVGDARKSG